MRQQTPAKPITKNYNKPAYLVFVAAGLVFLALRDFSQAAMYCSLALAFDPFNTALPFHKRPIYQKLWLYVHVTVSLGLFVLMFLRK